MGETFEHKEDEAKRPVYTDPNADVIPRRPEGAAEKTGEPESKPENETGSSAESAAEKTDEPESKPENETGNSAEDAAEKTDEQASRAQEAGSQAGAQTDSRAGAQDGAGTPGGQNRTQYYYDGAYPRQEFYQQGMEESPLSMLDWIITLVVSLIPCVGFIMYLVWAFSKSGNLNRRNFCRASLIIQAVGFVLVLILIVFLVALTGVMISSSGLYYY